MTDDAEKFVKSLKILRMYPFEDGIGNAFSLRIWEIHPNLLPKDIHDFMQNRINSGMVFIKEVVDKTIWESGPIFLSCPEVDYGNGALVKCFEWTFNPLMKGYNKEKGQYGEDL